MTRNRLIQMLCFVVAAVLPTTLPAQASDSHSLLATGSWYRIPITQTGIYRITTTQVPALEGTRCDRIAMYCAAGGMLSLNNGADHPDDLVPLAIRIDDNNGNGRFDAEDAVLFFAEAASVWRYNTQRAQFEYSMNAYASCNYCFLTPNGSHDDPTSLHIQPASEGTSTGGDIENNTVVALLHEDKVNTDATGQIWVADKFTPTLTQRTYTLTLPAVQPGTMVSARYAFYSHSSSYPRLEVTCNGTTRSHNLGGGSSYNVFTSNFTTGSNGTMEMTFTFVPTEDNAVGYIDYIELCHQAPIHYGGSQLTLRNRQNLSSGNRSRFVGTGYAAGLTAWDVTSPSRPSVLTLAGSGNGFSFVANTETAGTYMIFTPSDALTPSNVVPVGNQDIHGSEVPDYVIVTHSTFVSQAERVADLHRIHDGLNVLVVTQEEVFNEFSSGRPDPVAIRQMMRHFVRKAANEGGNAPRYLMLFGKGTYDNRNILGTDQSTVITYQTPTSFDNESSSYPTDDVFGYLGNNETEFSYLNLNLGIGRLPAKNSTEADWLVDKLQRYMEKSDLAMEDIRGDWRNYVCLLADDADPSCPHDTNFTTSSEHTATAIKRRYPQFNIDRIFADAYVQQSGADGSYYPDVNNALRRRLNYGCLVTNYIGHGSIQYIGTERYITLSDIDKYTNTDQLTFFITSTCSFGRYDHTETTSGAESLLLAPASAVGIITAARPISHNERFNTDCVLSVLNPDNSVGDALRQAKNNTSTAHSILLLGDPALHLSQPKNRVVITAINQKPVNDTVADSLQVLSRVTVEGEIRNADGSRNTLFDGIIYPIVFDREVQCHTLANDNDSTEVDFVQQKSILFKGRQPVKEGLFSYSFIIPRDVSYHYGNAKLSHYARTDNDDATGQYGNLFFGGLDTNAQISEVHPHVQLYIQNGQFRNGATTNETPTFTAVLTDSVGINAAGSGIGHDITATIDGNPFSTINLNDLFDPDLLDSRNGSVTYTLGKLDDGPHSLTVTCWNIYNYSGSATIHFNVANDRTPAISLFGAAPNPAHDRTTLRIEHNMPNAISNVHIVIYSTLGAPVKHIELSPTSDCYQECFSWDFTSDAGAKLSRGIYIARTTVTTTDGQSHTETTKIVKN